MFSAVCFIFLFCFKFLWGQELTNVKTALFPTNVWDINVNYLSADSPDFWRDYVLKVECESVIKFQEMYCLGKSIHVTVTNLDNPSIIYNLDVQSNQPFDCSSNVQRPDEAQMDPRYSHGELTVPTGVYLIKMKLEDYQNVLGFRGFAIKADVSLKRLIAASKCRPRYNANM